MSVLHTAQVRDAFVASYRNTDSTREERERLFYGWFNNELAKAWREGAMHGFTPDRRMMERRIRRRT